MLWYNPQCILTFLPFLFFVAYLFRQIIYRVGNLKGGEVGGGETKYPSAVINRFGDEF